MRKENIKRLSIAVLCWPAVAGADGLSDLKAALGREQGQAPIKGTLEVTYKHVHGTGKDAVEETGQVALAVEDGAQGLEVAYSHDTVAHLDAESLARERDKNAKVPTLPAVEMLRYRDIRGMTAAAQALERLLERSKFVSERQEAWNGQPARVLRFDMGLPPEVDDKQREYIKKHIGELDVWIAPDGTPLASRTHDMASGSAFLFLKFEFGVDEDSTYALAGDRLIAVKRGGTRTGRQLSDVQQFDITLAFHPQGEGVRAARR